MVKKIVNSFFTQNSDYEPPMAEPFANERKNIRFESGRIRSLGVLFLLFGRVRPMPAKTALKVENHSKEGHINTTVGKTGWKTLS